MRNFRLSLGRLAGRSRLSICFSPHEETNAKPQAAVARSILDNSPSCHSEGAAAAPAAAAGTSLATLLASHILRDGELVILILKPSVWFILLSSLRFIAAALILTIAAKLLDAQFQTAHHGYVTLGISIIVARLLWATLQWMGRLYILTDLRIVSISGVFSAEVFDCPLRKVARTLLTRGIQDRAVRVGSIEIIPQDESCPIGSWHTITKPIQVQQQIVATINRARQGGFKCG